MTVSKIHMAVKKTILLICLVPCLLAWTPAPEAIVHSSRPASQSQWLWNAEKPITSHGQSFFRLAVYINEPVKKAFLNIRFDDRGKLYVNGNKTEARRLKDGLKQGKNILAFKLENAFAAGGLLFYGEIHLASGKILYLHSNADVMASSTGADGWQEVDFDDSCWKPAKSQGDVLATPWSRYRNSIEGFTTPAEKAKINAANKKSHEISAKIAGESTPNVKIVYDGKLPKIAVNNKKMLPLIHLGETGTEFQDSILVRLNKLGVKIFQTGISTELYYKGEGNYDFRRLDQGARRILNLAPDSYLMLNIRMNYMPAWCQQYPDEIIGYADGKADKNTGNDYTDRVIRPSAASEKFQEEFKRQIAAFAEYIKKQPWKNRVIAFRISYGVYSEWHTYGMYHGPDTGKAMTRAFRKFLKDKYQIDQALQSAWGMSSVTLNTAMVPGIKERKNLKGFILHPTKNRQAMDYFECNAEVTANLLLMSAKEMKKHFPDRLCGAYYGYVFAGLAPEGSNVLLDKVLASPDIDFLSDPSFYGIYSRRAGGGYLHRTVPASHRRYGKLAIREDDSRFHHLPDYNEIENSTLSAAESHAVIRRNLCNMIFDGSGIQIMDASRGRSGDRPHNFDEPAVLKGFDETVKILKQLDNIPEKSGNEVLLVVDPREELHWNGGRPESMHSKLIQFTHQHLYRSGIGMDIMSLQDFLAAKNDEYKTLIFLNIFGPSAEERKMIKEKIRKKGMTAVWLVAPGYVTEKEFSDSAMSDLSGVQMKNASKSFIFIKCTDPDVKCIAPVTFAKTLADGSQSVIIPYPYENAEQWHKLFHALDIHLYTDPGSYVRRQGNFLMFHTGKTGKHLLRLPQEYRTATELYSGKEYKGESIELETESPMTWLFKLQ